MTPVAGDNVAAVADSRPATSSPFAPSAPGVRSWDLLASVAWSAGLCAILGGIVTLIGWVIPAPRLTDWLGLGISMFPNAALAAIFTGLAVILTARRAANGRRRLLVRALASLPALLGALTLLQHLTGLNFGIDEALIKGTWGQAASASPMRIGIPASTSFLLLGLALLLATGSRPARRIASGLALLPVGIAALSLTGYWFGANQLYGLARYTGISWQTAALVAALGLGVAATIREHGLAALLRRNDPGGVLARRMLLPIIVIPFGLGWMRVVGERAGYFDPVFGTAVRTLAEIALFLGFLWWTAASVSAHASAARRATRALRSSEERFTRFMQCLPGLAWIKDLSGRYVFANDAALRAFQRTRGSLYGHTDPDFLPPEIAADFIANDQRAIATGGPGVKVVETLRDPDDGAIRSSIVSKFPIHGADGRPALVGGIAIDITDRLQAEEALRDAHRRKDEFLATLAHELRNPLAPIRFAVHLFRNQSLDSADFRRSLDVVERQVQQMTRLLDDLLDISRISHGKLTLRREPLDLSTVIQRAIETSQPALDEGHHHLEPHLPAEPIVLEADPVRLAQVISNLLNNAAKFSPPGSRITLRAESTAGEVRLIVQDHGIGIPADKLPGLFEMFSQVHRPAARGGGLGIGLSLVRGLVELHGGRVEAASDGPDRGSTFTVRLPARADAPFSNGAAPVAVTGDHAPRRILVADDLRDGADSLGMLLRDLGHHVRVVYDGTAAVAAAGEFRPEIALLDIGMPHLTGHEVCRRLRAEPWGRDILIVAITGWGQETDRRLAAEAGFDHHFVKPVDLPTLLGLLAGPPTRRNVSPTTASRS